MSKNNLHTPPPPYYMVPQKNRWWVPVIITLVIIFGLFFGFITLMISGFGSFFEEDQYTVKDNSVLYLNISGKLEEKQNSSPFDFLNTKSKLTFTDLKMAIERAKDDPRIKGIYIKAGLASMGFAKATELKEKIEDFKKSGKFVYAYMNFGSELDYYISLSADKIFMAPEGIVELNGFAISTIFFKELFNKIGLDYFVVGFEDFKSAGEMYSRNNFSDSTRLEYQILLNQRIELLSNEVEAHRPMKKNDFINTINRGIYTPDSLYSLGLIDSLIYEDDVKEVMKRKIFSQSDKKTKEKDIAEENAETRKSKIKGKKDELNLVKVSNYHKDLPKIKDKIADSDKQIAIIYASGPLVEQIANSPFDNKNVITSKEIITALKKAREDDDIKVIILRVDSPGGAVLTSDAIYNEILKTKKIKPVYASMSDVAASGGYYISVACDTIVAHPATITGSIGVIMAIPNMSKLMDNIYLNVDTITTGPAATQFSGYFPLKKSDKETLKYYGGSVYKRFINKVAKNRNKTFDEIRAVAKGRVWTGEDAYKIGLVDVLGGLDKAIELAKLRMGIDKNTKVYIKSFPESKDPFEKLMEAFGLKPGDDEKIELDNNKIALNKIFGKDISTILPIYQSLPQDMRNQLSYMLTILSISQKEKVMLTMPELIEIK